MTSADATAELPIPNQELQKQIENILAGAFNNIEVRPHENLGKALERKLTHTLFSLITSHEVEAGGSPW